MVVGDKTDAGQGPTLNEDDPVGRLEPGPVVVDHTNPDGLLCSPASVKDEESRYDVLGYQRFIKILARRILIFITVGYLLSEISLSR